MELKYFTIYLHTIRHLLIWTPVKSKGRQGRKKFLGGGTVFGQDSVRTVLNIALAEFLGTGFLVFLGCMGTVVGLGEFPPTHLQISITFGMVVATAIQPREVSLLLGNLLKENIFTAQVQSTRGSRFTVVQPTRLVSFSLGSEKVCLAELTSFFHAAFDHRRMGIVFLLLVTVLFLETGEATLECGQYPSSRPLTSPANPYIFLIGHISAAHLNPAVSVAAIILGKINIPMAVVYILAELSGGIAGFGLLQVITPDSILRSKSNGSCCALCVTLPHPELSAFQAVLAEALATSVLILVVCAVWDKRNERNTDSVPLRFGFTVMAIASAEGPYTGASMNPARSLGPVIWTGVWESHWKLISRSISAFAAKLVKLDNLESAADRVPWREDARATAAKAKGAKRRSIV
uniref:Aquaporin 14 n=1 Tax=Timema tahoe TaxID=61484 RepID=A0A7R9FHF6_9NEOP|nr:unnamed protein product [Timema tahoe]